MNTRLPEQIPYGGIEQDFTDHIVIPDNYRIIFSGRFGSGKTEFLKQFFKENIDGSKPDFNYEVFHLYPVNYQVAANSDIFELIKYDILFRFLEKDWIEDNEQFSHCLAMQSFIMSKGVGHLLNILKSIEYHRINKIAELLDKLKTVYPDYQEYYKALNSGDFNFIDDYSKNLENTQGGIYEFDAVSQFIVKTIRNKKTEEKIVTVLIIDDLDRIDPEHIFRLLNVFSAHFDSTETRTNKFGFDKIIFVCDIENIRKIFHHKYGADVDFNGYINKFYSRKIFEFDLSKEILLKLDKIFTELSKDITSYFEAKKYFFEIVKNLVLIFINLKQCSIRDIEAFNNIPPFTLGLKQLNKSGRYFVITIVFEFLQSMFGSTKRVLSMLDECIDKSDELERESYNDRGFFYNITAQSTFLLIEKEKPGTDNYEIKNGSDHYKINLIFPRGRMENFINIKLMQNENTITQPTSKLTFILLQKAFEEIEKSRSLA